MKLKNEFGDVLQLKLILETVEAREEFIADLKAECIDDFAFFSIKKIGSRSVVLVFDAFIDELDLELFLDFLGQFYFESLEVKDEFGEYVLLYDLEELVEDHNGLNPVLSALVVWYSSQF